MNIVSLTSNNISETMDLFCKCFLDDHYYAEIFPDETTRAADMADAFRGTILYCMEHGIAMGVRDNGRLIGFFIGFDYKGIRDHDIRAFRTTFAGKDTGGSLPYDNSLHSTVSALPGTVMYCLSIAVDPEYQRYGIASAIWDRIIAMYPDCSFATDVSNSASLEIYRRRNFHIDLLDEEYYLLAHVPTESVSTFEITDTVQLVVPTVQILTDNHIEYTLLKEKTAVSMTGIRASHGTEFFIKDDNAISFGTLVELPYQSFLKYQRAINVSHFQETFCGAYVYFIQLTPHPFFPLDNDIQREMIRTRTQEWSIVPDVFISIPVQYHPDLFRKIPSAVQDKRTEALLKDLDFRTHYEAGIPISSAIVDDLATFKHRIVRKYLGKIALQISSENTVSQYDAAGDPIGNPIVIDMFLSADKSSECAVLTWYSLASPFILSQLLDNVIRNQLIVVENNVKKNFFDYLNHEYGIIRRGTPKAFVVIPREKSCLRNSQIASLLASETIYPDGEVYGEVIDPEITSIVRSELGMGQYDRAYVAAYTNVVLQFCPDMQYSLRDRLYEESITLFYIELILFEEAAIHIADREIITLFNSEDIEDPIEFLQHVDKIYNRYSKTIDFWDIQVNYPTSQKSINMLRGAFKIREKLEYMKRNQEQLQLVFDTKCDIVDRRDAKRMDTSLAILSILAVFSAWIDGHDYLTTWSDVFSPGLIYILQKVLFAVVLLTAVYAVTHLFGGRNGLIIRMRRARHLRRLHKRRKADSKESH